MAGYKKLAPLLRQPVTNGTVAMGFSSQIRLLPPLLVSLLIFACWPQALAAAETSGYQRERLIQGEDIDLSVLNSCKDPKLAELWKNALLNASTSQDQYPGLQLHLVTNGDGMEASDHDTTQWFRCKLTILLLVLRRHIWGEPNFALCCAGSSYCLPCMYWTQDIELHTDGIV